MKCENPKCGKEHDGSYGSGRFCCFECKQQFGQMSTKPHVCRFCGIEFASGAKLGSHVRGCKKNPKYIKRMNDLLASNEKERDLRDPITKYEIECQNCHTTFLVEVRKTAYAKGDYRHFCSSYCAHSYSAKCSTKESRKKISVSLKTRKHIIQCYECNSDIEKPICVSHALCDECKRKHFESRRKNHFSGQCVICGKQTKSNRLTCCKEHEMQARILSFKATAKTSNKVGGIRRGGGYGKHGWYKGYWCDSSWELAWVIYNLDHGIKFERCKEKFEYEFEGKKYRYYPDFKLEDGTYVEIKGYETLRWKAKLAQFPKDYSLLVLKKPEMLSYIEYAKSIYGDNFIQLYSTKKEQ